MNTTYAGNETLIGTWLAPLDAMRSVALVIVFSLLTALAAQIVIPLYPIPITGQTFAVLLTGALLGSRLGAMTMIAYIAEGAIGLPVFQEGSGGIAYLIGSPTVGYLLSYPFAAYIVGLLAEHGWDRKYLTAAAAMGVGSIVILCCGWVWLARLIGVSEAVLFGVKPFIIGEVIKVALAAAILPTGWALLKRKASQEN